MARPAISDLQGQAGLSPNDTLAPAQILDAGSAATSATGKTDQEIFEDLRVWIEKEKPTRDQIRKRVEKLRSLQTPTKK